MHQDPRRSAWKLRPSASQINMFNWVTSEPTSCKQHWFNHNSIACSLAMIPVCVNLRAWAWKGFSNAWKTLELRERPVNWEHFFYRNNCNGPNKLIKWVKNCCIEGFENTTSWADLCQGIRCSRRLLGLHARLGLALAKSTNFNWAWFTFGLVNASRGSLRRNLLQTKMVVPTN